MNTQTVSSATNEQVFLQRNALLSFVLGVIFTAELFEELFASAIANNYWLDMSLTGMAIVTFMTVIVLLVKTVKSVGGISKSAFWYGEFQDEYVNFLNLKGYKWAFNIKLAACFCNSVLLLCGFVRRFPNIEQQKLKCVNM